TYNNIGQIICVVCNIQVKNELLWPAHIQGKKHKENLALLKNKTQSKTAPDRTDTFVKPSVSVSSSFSATKRKSDTNVSNTSSAVKKQKVPEVSSSMQKRLPIDVYDDSESSEEEMEVSTTSSTTTTAIASQLPADFFDNSISSTSTTEEPSSANESASKDSKSNTAEALPEGFFDDPVMDAKVRKVEVKDPMMEEWDKFKKSIAEETTVSEAIQEEEDDERQRERQIVELDEQIHFLQKVETLRDKKEEISTKVADEKNLIEMDRSSDDEDDFEEFLDWRSKEAWM
ncbi:zinc finger protein 830-like, partial [Saccoglossus kowalevskii]